jgi:hypothetical protein
LERSVHNLLQPTIVLGKSLEFRDRLCKLRAFRFGSLSSGTQVGLKIDEWLPRPKEVMNVLAVQRGKRDKFLSLRRTSAFLDGNENRTAAVQDLCGILLGDSPRFASLGKPLSKNLGVNVIQLVHQTSPYRQAASVGKST